MNDPTPSPVRAIDESKVLVERVDHVLVIIINRPEARNAVNHDVWYGVGSAVEEAEHDPEIRAVVLTGAGDKAFSAGMDLKALMSGEQVVPDGMGQWNFAGFTRHFTSKPVIAAVNGAALGGGSELALACDLVVAAQHATFGLPEVKRGLIAAGGGTFRITRDLPFRKALEMLVTGDPISAAEAERWGMVNLVVPSGTELEAALDLARRIAANAPLAVQASKRLAYRLVDGEPAGEPAMWQANDAEMHRVFGSEDAQEGPRAFAEKRAPVWTGR